MAFALFGRKDEVKSFPPEDKRFRRKFMKVTNEGHRKSAVGGKQTLRIPAGWCVQEGFSNKDSRRGPQAAGRDWWDKCFLSHTDNSGLNLLGWLWI